MNVCRQASSRCPHLPEELRCLGPEKGAGVFTPVAGQPGRKRVSNATLSGYQVRPCVLVAGCLFPPARVSGFFSTDSLPAPPALISLQEEGKLPPFLF